VATAVDERGGRRSGGKRRQRKRAPKEKAQDAPVAPAPTADLDDLQALATAVAVMAAPEIAPPPIMEGNGHDLSLAPAVLLPDTEAPPAEEFHDLLGQAVGLRLDSVSREYGRGDEMHVSALKNISMQIGPCEFVSTRPACPSTSCRTATSPTTGSSA
jgi:hypothetical protein